MADLSLVYLGFGYDGAPTGLPFSQEMYQYNVVTNSWENIKPCFGKTRYAPIVGNINNNIYVGAGLRWDEDAPDGDGGTGGGGSTWPDNIYALLPGDTTGRQSLVKGNDNSGYIGGDFWCWAEPGIDPINGITSAGAYMPYNGVSLKYYPLGSTPSDPDSGISFPAGGGYWAIEGRYTECGYKTGNNTLADMLGGPYINVIVGANPSFDVYIQLTP